MDLSEDPRIPEKQYFRIGEVAEIAAVEPYVLRFWEKEFRTLRPSKSKSNQRMYARKDVGLVLRIRDLLYEEGFTIEGARRQLKSKTERRTEVPSRTREVLAIVRKEAQELLRLVEE
jgi:DNA-binding transcriptional MerR regulator